MQLFCTYERNLQVVITSMSRLYLGKLKYPGKSSHTQVKALLINNLCVSLAT